MNNHYKFLLSIVLLIITSSCGTEDECTVDDWAGTYSAEVTCDVVGMLNGMTIDTSLVLPLEELTIIKVDDQTVIFDDGGMINPEITVNGCEIEIDTSLSSNTAMSFARAVYILEGNQIRGIAEIDAAAFTGIQDPEIDFNCEFIFKRK